MWLSAHCVIGQNERRHSADRRHIAAANHDRGISDEAAMKSSSYCMARCCESTCLLGAVIGMPVAIADRMKRRTTVTTSVTRSA